MEARPRSLMDLFDGKRRYVIPLFQRQYVWNEERQWNPLWQDIRKQAEHARTRGEDVPPHFLGAIVINQMRTYGDQVPAHEVIDGQQRLTTFQIVLAALRDFAKEEGDAVIADELQRYTLNTGMMERAEEECFKVWPTHDDAPYFRAVVGLGDRKAVETRYPPIYKRKVLQERHRMVEAYLFFHRCIDEHLKEAGIERKEALRALYDTLRRRLQLVSIELSGTDDPQIIFETLNARGEPLLASDLLRNFIFLRASRSKENVEELYRTYWAPFDDEPDEPNNPDGKRFWKVQERQGRVLRARMDLFLQHFLAFKAGEEVNAGRLFHEYQRWTREKTPYATVRIELEDLSRNAAIFRRLFRPEATTRLGAFALRLREMDTSTVYPLMLALMSRKDLAPSDLESIVMDVESFLVRRMVCGYTSKNYNRYFLQLTREISKVARLDRAAVQAFLLASAGESITWPSDSEFKKAWMEQPAYQQLRQGRVEFVLRAIDEAMASDKGEKVTIHSDLSIEHVMPQSWEEHWPLPQSVRGDPAAESAAAQLRDALVHTFGNLTLLTQKLNTAVSNGAYATKRQEITDKSLLRMNSYFQRAPTWDEDAIQKRGSELFDKAKALWPRPGAST